MFSTFCVVACHSTLLAPLGERCALSFSEVLRHPSRSTGRSSRASVEVSRSSPTKRLPDAAEYGTMPEEPSPGATSSAKQRQAPTLGCANSFGADEPGSLAGILCLIGISTTDTAYESTWLASKLLGLKVFPEDKDGEVWGWKNSVVDAGYEVLCGESSRSTTGSPDAYWNTRAQSLNSLSTQISARAVSPTSTVQR